MLSHTWAQVASDHPMHPPNRSHPNAPTHVPDLTSDHHSAPRHHRPHAAYARACSIGGGVRDQEHLLGMRDLTRTWRSTWARLPPPACTRLLRVSPPTNNPRGTFSIEVRTGPRPSRRAPASHQGLVVGACCLDASSGQQRPGPRSPVPPPRLLLLPSRMKPKPGVANLDFSLEAPACRVNQCRHAPAKLTRYTPHSLDTGKEAGRAAALEASRLGQIDRSTLDRHTSTYHRVQ